MRKYPKSSLGLAIGNKHAITRDWKQTRYYIGRVLQEHDAFSYANQRKFLAALGKTDTRISIHFGRIEPRIAEDRAAKALLHYLNNLKVKIDTKVFADLVRLAKAHEEQLIYVEKAVDVNLAVDLVKLTVSNEYDAAYILSADGDFTSAVEFACEQNKKVFAASLGHGAQLAKVVNSFIHLKPDWFKDCYAD